MHLLGAAIVLWATAAQAAEVPPPYVDVELQRVIVSDDGAWKLFVGPRDSVLMQVRGSRLQLVQRFQGGFAGEAGKSEFRDLNGDGRPELDLVSGCGLVNCGHRIYVLDAISGTARLALRYSGYGAENIGERWVVTSRDGMEQWTAWYPILDWRRLSVAKKPADMAVALFAEGKCKLTFPVSARERADVKAWIEERCFPEAELRFGWRP